MQIISLKLDSPAPNISLIIFFLKAHALETKKGILLVTPANIEAPRKSIAFKLLIPTLLDGKESCPKFAGKLEKGSFANGSLTFSARHMLHQMIRT